MERLKKFERPKSLEAQMKTEYFEIVAQTDTGLVRKNNEDDFFIGEDLYQPWGAEFEVVFGDKYKNTFDYIANQVKPENQEAFEEKLKALIAKEAPSVLCDGMGGHGFGAEASKIASQVYYAEYLSHRISGKEMAKSMREAVFQTNQAVFNFNHNLIKACEDDNLKQEYEEAFKQKLDAKAIADKPAGSTLVASAFDQNKKELKIINVGDSRAYIFSQGRLNKITADHTVVNELITSGRITEDDEIIPELRPILSVNIGSVGIVRGENYLEKTLEDKKKDLGFDWEFSRKIESGDLVIFCSDGLTDMVKDPEIAKIIAQGGEIAQNLIEQAKANGGHDNITVIVTEFK